MVGFSLLVMLEHHENDVDEDEEHGETLKFCTDDEIEKLGLVEILKK